MAVDTSTDPAARYADFVAHSRFDALPADVVNTVKLFILDTLGVALAGSTAPACGELVEQVREWGGAAESTLLNFGGKVPVPSAALVNATLAEARDFDDTYDPGIVHVMAPTVPSALAMAERRKGVGGKLLITAIAAGAEIMCRVGAGCRSPLTWTRTATAGGFAAAAACARLLDYDAPSINHALGIAYVQAAGNSQTVEDGALVKRMQVGFAARAGVVAAQLAGRGVTGPLRIFEGKHGYFTLYERGDYNRDVLTDALGERYEVGRLSVKPYPCARDSHAAIDAAHTLRETGVAPADIAHVTVRASRAMINIGGKPWAEARGNPVVEAILSMPYAVAVMLLRGDLFIADFDRDAVLDPAVGDLARRISVVEDPDIDPSALVPVTLEARLSNGETRTARCDRMRGSPDAMLTRDEFIAKFRRCAEYAVHPLPSHRLDAVIDQVLNLEKVADASGLAAALSHS
jgi:2-methylcitrate dehydratase PrpD